MTSENAELERLRARVAELELIEAKAREFVANTLEQGRLHGRGFTVLRSVVGMGGANWRDLDPRLVAASTD
jgi:hypothetical protein